MPHSTRTWLITGAGGLLGREFVHAAQRHDVPFTAMTRQELDITEPGAVRRAVEGVDIVVNCAAFTDVDAAQNHPEQAHLINATGASHVATACADAGAAMVQISTDYVFSGHEHTPYGEASAVDPSTVYGQTKADGEAAVLASGAHAWVARTAWLYGEYGPCFPTKILARAQETGVLNVVDDQIGQPTWAHDVAEFVFRLVDVNPPPGIVHATAQGQASWWEFATEVMAASSLSVPVAAASSADFARPAPRPAWSVLGHEGTRTAGVEPIGHWRDRWHEAAHAVLG